MPTSSRNTEPSEVMSGSDVGNRNVNARKRNHVSKSELPLRKKPKLVEQEHQHDGREKISPATSGRIHVRFDSEELDPNPELSIDVPAHSSTSVINHDTIVDHDSDDDAPEAVPAAVAASTRKAAAISIAEAVKQHKTRHKVKRQKEAARFVEQAALSGRKATILKLKETLKTDEAQTSKEEEVISHTNSSSNGSTLPKDVFDDDPIPDLLPDEVLAQEFVRQLSPPPTPRNGSPKDARLRKDVKKNSSPKDILVGPVNVSILNKVNKFLPPASASQSRQMREGWLAGRQGRGGTTLAQRKRINTGFVKR